MNKISITFSLKSPNGNLHGRGTFGVVVQWHKNECPLFRDRHPWPGMPEKYDGRKGANGAGEESSYGDNVRGGGGGTGSDFTFIIAVNDSGMGIGNGGAHDGGRDGIVKGVGEWSRRGSESSKFQFYFVRP